MWRSMTAMMIGVTLLCGCQQSQHPMGPPQKPDPAPELARLQYMLGNWEGTAEMVEPSWEDMQADAPEGSEPMENSFKGGTTMTWALNGMFLKSDGWHEMGPDERMNMVEYVTWDSKARKFHSWYFSDWGECGEGWWTPSEDFRSFTIRMKGRDSQGRTSTGEGTFSCPDDDTMEWTWSENGPNGKMKLKGVSHRRK